MNRQFSKAQNIAINHNTGSCLVLAGPGSGKTMVITHRTKNLIEQCGVNPSNILVITFTKAAAMEMQGRFEKLMNGQRMAVSFGTFHAVFFKILKYAYNYSASNIISEDTKFRYIKELVDRHQLDIEDENEFINSVISEISNVKGDLINPDNYYSKNCSDEIFKDIYNKYEEHLRRSNMIDFDDMLLMCYDLFKARKDILELWQRKYKYILIDEFQDINKIQYEIVRMLAKPEDNLFIVGDDDQSIYRFRGARPEIMLNFEKDYPSSKRVILDENYRSYEEIVKASGRLIKNNEKRFTKEVRAVRGNGGKVEIREFKNSLIESDEIIEKIRKYSANGGKYSDIAILFRTNTGPRFLIGKFMEYGIPFRMKDAMPNIYDHFISKNIISYINVALGSNKRSDFLEIVNRPKRYISRENLQMENISLNELAKSYSDKPWMIERIEKLGYDLNMLKSMAPYAAINYLRKAVGYDRYLEEYAEFRRMNVADLMETADEIEQQAKNYKTYDEWFEHIKKYSEELVIQAKRNKISENAVEFATMHSSKGLEYKYVFIIDAVEGVTPHNKAVLDDDIEEERRMFYVAMTRAKDKLFIYSVKERFDKTVSVSRFIAEIETDFDNIKGKDKVKHIKYGVGNVMKIEEGKIYIYFPKLRKEMIFDMKYSFANKLIEKYIEE